MEACDDPTGHRVPSSSSEEQSKPSALPEKFEPPDNPVQGYTPKFYERHTYDDAEEKGSNGFDYSKVEQDRSYVSRIVTLSFFPSLPNLHVSLLILKC